MLSPGHAITEVTNPRLELASPPPSERSRFASALGGLISRANRQEPQPSVVDIDLNVAAAYGIRWDVEKCGRDALQNFFDANGGTLDGVEIRAGDLPPSERNQRPVHAVHISGNSSYDYKVLTVIGATTKHIGGQTAGGFGEGAKFLALSLLRNHKAERVIYRSMDWQLEFFIHDFPAEKLGQPARGLFARVATGLETIAGSSMLVTSRDPATPLAIANSKRFFMSSENPDFSDNVLQKTLPDGTQTGVKFLGVKPSGSTSYLNTGHLYIAGQRRHYSPFGGLPTSWDTVKGLSVWTTKDVVSGDRDRGQIAKGALKREVFTPLVEALDSEEIAAYFQAIEEAYSSKVSSLSELEALNEMLAAKGESLGVKLAFDRTYVALAPLTPHFMREAIEKAGYALCPEYYKNVGMQTSAEVIRKLHEHQRLAPSPEQQVRIDILQEGLAILTEAGKLKKDLNPREVWLFSKQLERNPFEGSYDEGLVWISEEHLGGEFAEAFATYLHELDHEHGDDTSATFSYALTHTLAEVVHAIAAHPHIGQKFAALTMRWQAAQKVDDSQEY